MAGSTEHNKIAAIAGIPGHISNAINNFIDDINPLKEFDEHNNERKIFVCGHLNVSIRTLEREKLKGRGKEWIQQEDLKWLLATRREYIKCYYLHLAVDTIYENRDWIMDGRQTIEDLINKWKNNAVVIPGIEPYLKDVSEFLSNNTENISQILFRS